MAAAFSHPNFTMSGLQERSYAFRPSISFNPYGFTKDWRAAFAYLRSVLLTNGPGLRIWIPIYLLPSSLKIGLSLLGVAGDEHDAERYVTIDVVAWIAPARAGNAKLARIICIEATAPDTSMSSIRRTCWIRHRLPR